MAVNGGIGGTYGGNGGRGQLTWSNPRNAILAENGTNTIGWANIPEDVRGAGVSGGYNDIKVDDGDINYTIRLATSGGGGFGGCGGKISGSIASDVAFRVICIGGGGGGGYGGNGGNTTLYRISTEDAGGAGGGGGGGYCSKGGNGAAGSQSISTRGGGAGGGGGGYYGNGGDGRITIGHPSGGGGGGYYGSGGRSGGRGAGGGGGGYGNGGNGNSNSNGGYGAGGGGPYGNGGDGICIIQYYE